MLNRILLSAVTLARTGMLAVVALLAAQLAHAQDWPNKPVRLIVPFPPGGGTDAFARPLAAVLSKQLGQQFVVDSRGGAGGNSGADLAAKATPDGYTFLLGAVHHTVAVSAYKSLPYDLEKDLIPVTGVGYVPDVLVASEKLQAKSIRELIAYSKANPGKINYGSSGNGTTRHLAGEIFNSLTGTSMVHVPYKGSGPAMVALLGSEIDLIFEGLGSASPHIRAGKIRALAVTSPKRSPAFPDIPTMAEAGVPGFESLSWYGLWAPAGTPKEIILKMQIETAKALATPELKNIWALQGAEPGGESSEQFAKLVRSEIEKWGKVVRQNKVMIE
ncbi:MAG: tripartite tricarboxylate transporter substrate binding protein [Usitatibacteraceae bacterium]